jgi:LEA14-like dessication related protein
MRRILLLWPLLASCSLFQSLASSAVERPSLSFKEAKLPRIDFEGADLNLVFLVTNPNRVGLDLAQSDYALDVEGHRLVAGKPRNGLKIPPGGTTEVTFPATLHWNDVAPALEALFAQDKIKYKASGVLGLNSPAGLISLPLQHEGTFEAPRMPKFDVGSPKITSLLLTGARIELPLKISNLNAFPLPLGGILGTVEIAGARVGRIAMPQSAPVPAGKELTLRIPLDVNFLSAGAAAAQAIKSGIAEVKIDATLNAAGATLPVKIARTVELSRATGSAGP